MKWKKVMALVLVLAFTSSASVVADDIYNTYKARPIKVSVNNVGVDTPGLIISSDDKTLDSKAMLPLRDIAGALQALVKWNPVNQTVNIYKPNVHILLLTAKDRKPFGIVYKGKNDFYIFSQVDNLLTSIDSFKITIEDPYGTVVKSIEPELKEADKSKSDFWYMSEPLTVDFKSTGNYTLNYYMKVDKDSDYALVSQKEINCISQQ